jgi:hypothetical protein
MALNLLRAECVKWMAVQHSASSIHSMGERKKQMQRIEWEALACSTIDMYPVSFSRCPVPGGWLIFVTRKQGESGLSFMPDPNHSWDGSGSPK